MEEYGYDNPENMCREVYIDKTLVIWFSHEVFTENYILPLLRGSIDSGRSEQEEGMIKELYSNMGLWSAGKIVGNNDAM